MRAPVNTQHEAAIAPTVERISDKIIVDTLADCAADYLYKKMLENQVVLDAAIINEIDDFFK